MLTRRELLTSPVSYARPEHITEKMEGKSLSNAENSPYAAFRWKVFDTFKAAQPNWQCMCLQELNLLYPEYAQSPMPSSPTPPAPTPLQTQIESLISALKLEPLGDPAIFQNPSGLLLLALPLGPKTDET